MLTCTASLRITGWIISAGSDLAATISFPGAPALGLRFREQAAAASRRLTVMEASSSARTGRARTGRQDGAFPLQQVRRDGVGVRIGRERRKGLDGAADVETPTAQQRLLTQRLL